MRARNFVIRAAPLIAGFLFLAHPTFAQTPRAASPKSPMTEAKKLTTASPVQPRPASPISIIKKGEAPFRLLRYAPEVGAVQKVERASEPGASRNAPRGATPPPIERQLYRLEAARSDENEIFFFGELESIDIGTPGGAVGDREDLRRKVAEAFKGVGYGYTMTPQGQPLETDAPMMSRAGFRDLRLLLPAEEIGAGGVWRYDQVVPEADLQMATQIQITKMDAHGFVAKLLVEGISEGFALRREGTCKINLNRLAPVEMDLTDTIQLTEPAAPAGDKPSMPKVTNIRMKIRVRETLYAGVAEIGRELTQADLSVNEARELWDKNDREGSLRAADRALGLRRKWLGEDHAKTRELKEMIRGAREMSK